MGLLTILKKVKQKEKELRILILGLDNAGKTTIMKRVLGEDHHEISPTVGFNIKTLEYNGLNLNLWDVGGQKSIRTYWRNYFEQTDGIIWVVDSVDRWRLEECKSHLRELLTQEKLAGSSLLIFANKQDLGGALTFEQIAEFLDLKSDDISGRHWKIIGCSAMTGEGLSEGFDCAMDSDLPASELRKRYLRGGTMNDDELTSAQLRARHAIPSNSKDFSAADGEGKSSSSGPVGLVVVVIIVLVVIGFIYMQQKS